MTTVRGGQQQHVDMWRKVRLRRRVLDRMDIEGAAYVPFIGDGDIAAQLYADRRVFGADIDPERVATARARLPDAHLLTADCDRWPLAGQHVDQHVAVGDFDAYSYPYASFRAFWESSAARAQRMAVFFTDAQRQSVIRNGHWHPFDEEATTLEPGTNARRRVYNFYLRRHVLPRFEAYIAPWRMTGVWSYLRGGMVYWGAIIEG